MAQNARREELAEGLYRLTDLEKKTPSLSGVPTGIPGLDELFYRLEWKEGKPQKVPLPGFPRYAVIHLTGVPDTGKSLAAEQFALAQAGRGEKVLLVTVELPGPFLVQSLRERSRTMGISWDKVERNILLADCATHSELRDNVVALTSLIEGVVGREGIKHVVIDSVTGLYEGKEMMARGIVRKLYQAMKTLYQTAVFISQKRSSHEETSAEAAGGYAVPHIVDCTIVFSKFTINSKQAANLYNAQIGDVVRTLRIDGCRLCAHDTRTHRLVIDGQGMVRVERPLYEEG
ncbi:MAG: KaiC domain-containing protein [Candidatus Atribacteria bacterium]|nr:KaiC domain-containing protein [Candidatus Atribacteria bacterium]MCD6349903.1 KaiC domain-containing protein [Candidatus Atribacteria bacterium]